MLPGPWRTMPLGVRKDVQERATAASPRGDPRRRSRGASRQVDLSIRSPRGRLGHGGAGRVQFSKKCLFVVGLGSACRIAGHIAVAALSSNVVAPPPLLAPAPLVDRCRWQGACFRASSYSSNSFFVCLSTLLSRNRSSQGLGGNFGCSVASSSGRSSDRKVMPASRRSMHPGGPSELCARQVGPRAHLCRPLGLASCGHSARCFCGTISALGCTSFLPCMRQTTPLVADIVRGCSAEVI